IDADTGRAVKKRVYEFINGTGSINVIKELCTEDKAYFMAHSNQDSKLFEVDMNTYSQRVVKTYPKDTYLKMMDNNDGTIIFYGSTSSLTDEFHSDYYTNTLAGPKFFISGIMNDFSSSANELDVKSIRAISVNGNVLPSQVINVSPGRMIVGGTTTDTNNFTENLSVYDTDGKVRPQLTASGTLGFVGVLEIKDDYPPIIKGNDSIVVDISDAAIKNPVSAAYRGWNSKDRWLITGTKNGEVTSPEAIKVYDHGDFQDVNIGTDLQAREEWLQSRINRNPKSIQDEIEWETLGFDETKAGPQTVTYFVTDTQNQIVVTSRLIHKRTSQTIENGNYFFDAQNFHIPLIGIDSAFPDNAAFKKMAKTMAWNKTDGSIDEDGTSTGVSADSTKVTVNGTQLQALRDATIAKPYPVDVSYRPKTGVEITNRVWVFVTTTNTLPNASGDTPENGVIFYGNDYTLPFRMRNTHNNNQSLTLSDAKVYNYFDSSNETAAELPTLADANKNPEKLMVDLPTLRSATDPSTVRLSIEYEWEGTTDGYHTTGSKTTGYVDVELTGNVLLHVRQVVLDNSNEIVVPTESYFNVQNVLSNTGTLDPSYQINFVGKSGTLMEDPSFTEAVVSVDHLPNVNDQVQLSIIIPEFYQYAGYYFTTDSGGSHTGNTAYTGGTFQMRKEDLYNVGEYWITMYIKPNTNDQGDTKSPQPYSW
ncbi:hypothetical protein JZO70_22150, partial [Enterococcus sp. 669A]|nr:hypothetical protein [Enterococcus sp. 669A]